MSGDLINQKADIHHIFDKISPTYDRINTLLSCNFDAYWRRFLVSKVKKIFKQTEPTILDLATGTGSQLVALYQQMKFKEAVGIDPSIGMLSIAQKKLPSANFLEGSALSIPFSDNYFDAITISFGIRNIANIDKALEEMYRTLKVGGWTFILEFSLPTQPFFKRIYLLYLRKILPKIGKLVSKHPSAYTYLNQTIETFPYGKQFSKYMEQAGFQNIQIFPMQFGIVTLYLGQKSHAPSNMS